MKRTVRPNIDPPYSLHDMNIIAFEAEGDKLTLRTQSGMVKTTTPCSQLDGYIEFHSVQWDFCYIYLLGVTGNESVFSGEKMFLKNFLAKGAPFGFSVMDETFGFRQTKLSGYLLSQGRHNECVVEIYHEGDMVYVTEE